MESILNGIGLSKNRKSAIIEGEELGKQKMQKLKTINYISDLFKLEAVNDHKVCLLMSRLEELFAENPDGFFKYIKPCAEQKKLDGFSWVEELNFGRKDFPKAFDAIGIKYKSVEIYRRERDKFKGKYYCSVKDFHTYNRTMYFRNHELINRDLNNIAQINAAVESLRTKSN